MAFKNFALCLSATGLLVVAFASTESAALAKTAKAPAHKTGRGAYLVPPPPPYQPSILPEYSMSNASYSSAPVAKIADAKIDSPYSKYIYTAKIADAPRVVHNNGYVQTWNR